MSEKIIKFDNIIYALKQIPVCNTVMVAYKPKNDNRRYKLYRESKSKKIIPIHKPLKINIEHKIDKNRLLENSLGNSVLEFVNEILKKFSHVNLSYLYSNLKNIEIFTKGLKLYNFIFGRTASGTYSVSKNVIHVYNNTELDSLFHELFHMASTVVDKERNLIFTGFSQFSKKKKYFIGKGITEGYTQLLTQRCFGNTHKIRQAYIVQVTIAELLEKIICKEKMEHLYFSADLLGLVEELKKYESEENIMTFIDEMDFLNENIDKNKLMIVEKKKVEKSLNYVHLFLLQCYCKKLKYTFKNNDISYEEVEKLLEKFKVELYYEYHTSNKVYLSVDEIVIQMTIENTLSNLYFEKFIDSKEKPKKY